MDSVQRATRDMGREREREGEREKERERRLHNTECKTVAVCFNVQCTESVEGQREREGCTIQNLKCSSVP